jgi:predicted nucleic-acid-binding Zn-ribbon protein
MQGKSLLPILKNEQAKTKHKESVYCEFYSALKGSHENIYGTMLFDGRYKIIRYHNCEYGELYDLQKDPDEYHNLWEEPDYSFIKHWMILKAFDRSVMTIDPNPPMIGRY